MAVWPPLHDEIQTRMGLAMLETLKALQPLLQTLVWTLLILLAVLVLRREIRTLVNRILTAQDISLKAGPLSLEAKATREIRNTIQTEFSGNTITKAEIENLLDEKLRSLHGTIERELASSELRSSERHPASGNILFTRDDGTKYSGTLLNVSKGGVGFSSEKLLRRSEILKVGDVDLTSDAPVEIPQAVKIVRMGSTNGGYLYGCAKSF